MCSSHLVHFTPSLFDYVHSSFITSPFHSSTLQISLLGLACHVCIYVIRVQNKDDQTKSNVDLLAVSKTHHGQLRGLFIFKKK